MSDAERRFAILQSEVVEFLEEGALPPDLEAWQADGDQWVGRIDSPRWPWVPDLITLSREVVGEAGQAMLVEPVAVERGRSSNATNHAPRRTAPHGQLDEVIVGVLLHHHQYDRCSVLCHDPIDVPENVRRLEKQEKKMREEGRDFFAPDAAAFSRFWKKHFGNYSSYKAACTQETLFKTLAILAGDTSILRAASYEENRGDVD